MNLYVLVRYGPPGADPAILGVYLSFERAKRHCPAGLVWTEHRWNGDYWEGLDDQNASLSYCCYRRIAESPPYGDPGI